MRKPLYLICIFCLMLFSLSNAYSTVFTFRPQDLNHDLQDLEHQYYYSWQILWSIPDGEHITKATLKFFDIYNWAIENNDRLYIHLLDDPPILSTLIGSNSSGKVWKQWDNQSNGDAFNGQGIKVVDPYWTDLTDTVPKYLEFGFDNNQLNILENYVADGKFGLGVDPECHYFNRTIKFQINTEPIPEPNTLILVGIGATGNAIRRKKKA